MSGSQDGDSIAMAHRQPPGGGTPGPDDLAAYRKRVREIAESFAEEMAVWERDGHLPRELFRALGSAGLFKERWQHGATGGLPLARALVEELALRNGGAALAVSIHSEVFTHALRRFGQEIHHREILGQALNGEAVGCFAVTEPGGGSDMSAIASRAVRTKDGWHLTGSKCFTSNAGRSSHALVLAGTGDTPGDFDLFLVPLDRPGVTVKGFFNTLGVRSVDTAVIDFDTHLDHCAVIGKPGRALFSVMRLLDFERIAAATGLVAGARFVLGLAVAYMRERKQFGKRLFDQQALSHRIADRWAEVEAAAALLDKACQPRRGDYLQSQLIAAAKLTAARSCGAAVDDVLQIFGARGYTDAYPFERMYRDARMARIGASTDEVLRQIIAFGLDVHNSEMFAILNELRQNDGTS